MTKSARYLLDTNILSDLIKNPRSPLAQRVGRQADQLCTSLIVACELRYGAAKKGGVTLQQKVNALLDQFPVRSLEDGVDRQYGKIRAELERQGKPIGMNDLLIAAHARHLGLTLVTANTREFQRVPGLTVENWLADIS